MEKNEMREMITKAKKEFFKKGGKVTKLDPQSNGKVISKFKKAANPTIDPETNERPKSFVRSKTRPDQIVE